MKKFIVIAVLLVYGLAAFGVSLNYFYCCGKLKEVSVKLNPPTNHKCPMTGDKDCCKNETVNVKISAEQLNSQQIVFEPIIFTAPAILQFNFIDAFNNQHLKAYAQNRPPPLSQPHLHLLNCSFLI